MKGCVSYIVNICGQWRFRPSIRAPKLSTVRFRLLKIHITVNMMDKAEKARELYRQGKSDQDIIKELGISKPTYYRFWRDLGGKTTEDKVSNLIAKEENEKTQS